MNILLLSNCPLDDNQGSGYVTCRFWKGMEDRGHRFQAYGVDDLLILRGMRRGRRLRLLVGYTLRALKGALLERVDVLELWGGPGWLAILLIRAFLPFRRFAVIARSNGLESHNAWVDAGGAASGPSGFSLAELGFRMADGLTLVSEYDAKFAREKRYQPEDRLCVVENPLDDPWLLEPIAPRSSRTIMFVGSWVSRKGSSFLPTAFSRILEDFPDWNLVVVGVGADGAADLGGLREFGDRFTVIEKCTRSELRALYEDARVLVLASSYESFGLVLAEASARGMSLVSTPVGYAAGLEDGRDYVKIRERSAAGVVEAFTRLVTTPGLLGEVASRGCLRTQRNTWARALDTWEAFAVRLVATKRMKDASAL